MKYNENFRKLSDSYVFAGINARKATAKEKWGDKLLDLGVGDVKLPLFPVVAEEMKKALDEMTTLSGFKGYSPSSGYDFLKEAIAKDYSDKGVAVRKSEIFVNDGAKEELYDIFGLLNPNSRIIVPTPCYPAVAEANLLLGNEVIYIESDEDLPLLAVKPERRGVGLQNSRPMGQLRYFRERRYRFRRGVFRLSVGRLPRLDFSHPERKKVFDRSPFFFKRLRLYGTSARLLGNTRRTPRSGQVQKTQVGMQQQRRFIRYSARRSFVPFGRGTSGNEKTG